MTISTLNTALSFFLHPITTPGKADADDETVGGGVDEDDSVGSGVLRGKGSAAGETKDPS